MTLALLSQSQWSFSLGGSSSSTKYNKFTDDVYYDLSYLYQKGNELADRLAHAFTAGELCKHCLKADH